MPTLKGLLFNQYATEGLSGLVEEMQSKYTAKKGRRFNHDNICLLYTSDAADE